VKCAQRYLATMVIVLASLLATAGCVNVPTTGPIEKVEEGQQPPCCVNVEVAFPAPGADSKEIVEGYLRATSYYQPNYSVAKQFLTRMAAEKWSPEEGASIYQGSLTATADNTVRLAGQLVGSLQRDRTYTVLDEKREWNFHLVKENGEWRIENPPGGLMVDLVYFKSFYQPYDLYFVGNDRSLVSDPIYLPALSNPANVASALIKALLRGPTTWLKPAVSSAIPPNTTLSVDSVTITAGIAEVPLSDSVLDLPDRQRSMLAAQIVYTLRQVAGVKGVLIKVNQQPYRVPGSDPNSPGISVGAIPQDLDPVPFVAGEPLYAIQAGVVKQVTTTSDSSTVSPLGRSLGGASNPINALAVSITNTDLAFTTNDRTTLRRARISEGEPNTLLDRVGGLLRPQLTKYGEIWDIGQKGGRQQIWMFMPDKDGYKQIPVNSPLVQDSKVTVTAFKISPDGTRMALVRRSETGSEELGLARIIRSDKKILVDGWRVLDTTQTNLPSIHAIADVAWLDGTELLVLGAADRNAAFAPFRVVEDASRISPEGQPENGSGRELTVLPRTQSAIIVGRDGRTWKDDGSQWRPFLNKTIGTIAYPG
jgi:hypothetical protein